MYKYYPPTLTLEEKNKISLTPIQKEIIIGGLLGDSGLAKRNKKGSTLLSIIRAIKDLKYLEWEYNIFRNLCTDTGIKIVNTYDKRTNKSYESCRFNTMSLHCLNEFKEMWYHNGIKIIPQTLELTPLILARLIADDGNIRKIKNSYTCSIATNCFTYDEVLFLKTLIENITKEKFFIIHDSKNKPVIMGSSLATLSLLDIIEPYLLKMNMERKIPKNKNSHTMLKMIYDLLECIQNNPNLSSEELYNKIKYNKTKYASLNSLRSTIVNISNKKLINREKDKSIYKRGIYRFTISEKGLNALKNKRLEFYHRTL